MRRRLVAVATALALPIAAGAETFGAEGLQLVVKFRSSAKASDRARVESEHKLTRSRRIPGLNADVYRVAPSDTPSGVVKELRAKHAELIEYTEPDRLASITYVPNDEMLANQWHHGAIGGPQAWNTGKGEGESVAIIDTGVDLTHPDLAASVIPGWNFWQNNSDVSDSFGHGTNVAGAAAAIGDNLIGVAGVAYRSRLLAIRMPATLELSLLAEAVVYAADNGARVANMSYAPACDSLTIGDAASYIRARGGVLVVSAGNDPVEVLADDLPMTCVAATDQAGAVAGFSTYGPIVDVSAPGVAILTTARGGGYGAASGTSFSAPVTAGIYALMFSVNPNLTPFQADRILFSNARDSGAAGYDRRFGFGRVDAAAAVELAALTEAPPPDGAPPTAPGSLTSTVAGTNVALSWTPSADDYGVAYYMIYRGGHRVGSTAGTSYAETLPDASGIFSYSVRAFDEGGNASPPSTVGVKGANYVAPTLSRVRASPLATSATISWITNKPATGVVSFQPAMGGPVMTVAAPSLLTSQSVTLAGLAKGTKYLYSITATDQWGGSVNGAQSAFTTARK